jgi:hypothetical protein
VTQGPEVHIKTVKPRRQTVAKPRKQTARDKGVPEQYLSEKGTFKIGHDAKYKSDLIKAALEFEATNKGRKTSDAHKALTRMAWTSHLDASRASRARKAERKTAKAEAGPAKREGKVQAEVAKAEMDAA